MNAAKAREGSQSVCRAVLCNGQTAAIICTNLTVGVAICAMIVVSTSTIRVELRTEIRRLDANMQEMRKELSAEIKGLDGSLSVVEQTVAVVNARLTPGLRELPDPADLARGVSPESDG